MNVVTSTLAHLLQRGKSGRRAIPDAPLRDLYPPEPLCPSPPGPDESDPDESEPDESEPEVDESEPDESEPDDSKPDVDESEPDESEPGPLLLPSEPEPDDSGLGPLELLSTLCPLESGFETGSPLALSCEPGPELFEAGWVVGARPGPDDNPTVVGGVEPDGPGPELELTGVAVCGRDGPRPPPRARGRAGDDRCSHRLPSGYATPPVPAPGEPTPSRSARSGAGLPPACHG